jgi:peptidyl-prolyl cis-trans isomerase SurA
MKRIILVLINIILLLPVVSLSQKKVVDRIVAIVDNEIILESEYNLNVMRYAAKEKIDPQSPELRKIVLEDMVNNHLILAQARLDSIVVTDEEVTQSTDEQIKALVQQYGSEEKLSQAANMPVSKMRFEFREDMKKRLLIEKIQQNMRANIRVSRREVEEFYNTYKDSLPPVPEEVELYHIFIIPKPSENLKNQTHSFAQKILDSIKSGSEFSLMAQRYSNHPSGKIGGDLPLVKRGTFVKEFEEAAFALQIGQVSNVIESPLGFHIIKLVDRKGESILVKQILFKITKSQSDDSTAIEFLNSLRERVKKGEKFSDLAKKYSEDPNTKDFGGLIGKLTLSELPEDFVKNIKNLKPGEISEPQKYVFGNNYGYHIILVDKKIPAHKMMLESDMSRVEAMAKQNKLSQEYKKILDDVKKQIYWEIRQ